MKRSSAIVLMILGAVAGVICLELILRLLPVRQSPQTQPVTSAAPIIHFKPGHSFRFSTGWNFSINRVKTANNYGFLSDGDYHENESAPLLLVVGDSYVEAMQVANSQGIAGLLDEHARASGQRAYGLGYSGSPLSQYLAFSEFARDEFSPEALAVVVVGNDFDESLKWYKSAAGSHYFNRGSNGALVLERIDWSGLSPVSSLSESSALSMYLLGNLGLYGKLSHFWKNRTRSFVGNVDSDANERRLRDSREAVDEFLKRLPLASGLPPDSILFVVDGLRPQLYDEDDLRAVQDSYAAQMFDYFKAQATRGGFRIVDMEPIFIRHFKEHGQRFEFPDDAHWNVLGHQVAFEAVIASGIFDKLKR